MARIWKSFYDFPKFNNNIFFFAGVRQEQDIYVRLIDSVTKQVSINKINL